ncbi:MAG: cytochrome ubiquinol oxidase subunit I [Dysgonamonadaceae bacterium]|jgi:cytochrome d ubiquinol oxidase subunit I|nr:cytochrome ubiquinol oxidase subunit I [Dysgonamonadaceae bacterium]
MEQNLIDLSRAQFALTAMFHWLFVPLTLGLGLIVAIMETLYVKGKGEKWKTTTRFWMKIFGINFAVGVASGIILEFEFGTNWAKYSWFVGDIFGVPLAIEGIVAFFMEATFIAVMFFGWDKVSKRFHLAATWLTLLGATLSAVWILVANAWMQNPVGIGEFNVDLVRTELSSFWAVISPLAIVKFLHTVISSWMLAAAVVIGIASFYLLKGREKTFALDSIRVAVKVGIAGVIAAIITGDMSGNLVAKTQPMKLAAMESLYDGHNNAGLVALAVLNPDKKFDDGKDPFLFNVSFPNMLSFLATRNSNGFVPGINDVLKGGYIGPDGAQTISVNEKIALGKDASLALKEYKNAATEDEKTKARNAFRKNEKYFGYSFFKSAEETIPPVGLVFYAFRIMVALGFLFLILFITVEYFLHKKRFEKARLLQKICLLSIPFAYIASQAGWIVAEVGRQPWAIQDILPVKAAVTNIGATSVILTFCFFLVLFSVLLVAEVNIIRKAIRTGPEENPQNTNQ